MNGETKLYKYIREGKNVILGYGTYSKYYLKNPKKLKKPLFIYPLNFGRRLLYNNFWKEIKDVTKEPADIQKEIFKYFLNKE